MNDLISIIVPVYNCEKYIEECVDSILKSTFSSLEIILVDDGSKDNSPAICDRYAEQYPDKVKVLHITNGGASRARNLGLKEAHGNLIGYVDADDIIAPDMYQYLYDLMNKYDVDMSVCSYTTKDPKYMDQGYENEQITEFRSEKDIMDFFYRLNGGISFYAIWNRLYKREIVEGLQFLEGFITEDCYYIYEVYKRCSNFVLSNLKKYYYRQNNGGVTRSKLKKKDDCLLKIWDMIVEREKGGIWEDAAVFNRKRAAFTLASKGVMFGKDDSVSDEYMNNLKKEVREYKNDLKKSNALDFKRKILLEVITRV